MTLKQRILETLALWYDVSDKPLPKWLSVRINRDSKLASALADDRSVGEALRQSRPAKKLEGQASRNLASAVMRQITEEDYLADQKQSSASGFHAWGRNAAAALALVAVVASVSFLLRQPEGPQPGQVPTTPQGPAEIVTVHPTNAIPDSPANELIKDLDTDWKNPLDQEIEYVIADAKGALGFLANTFVPSAYLKSKDNA